LTAEKRRKAWIIFVDIIVAERREKRVSLAPSSPFFLWRGLLASSSPSEKAAVCGVSPVLNI